MKGWENKFVIIYVGAHGVANHLIQMVEAAELLKGQKEIHFVSIGDGMQRKTLMEEAKKRNLSNIEFIASVPKTDVFRYILASDIGTSILKKVDTFKTVYSNKTFDYMSCKKPVLMAIDGVSRELVEQARCGAFVVPEDPQDFSKKVQMYLNDRGKVEEQGRNGYEYAQKHFDRKVLAKKYLEALERIKKNV